MKKEFLLNWNKIKKIFEYTSILIVSFFMSKLFLMFYFNSIITNESLFFTFIIFLFTLLFSFSIVNIYRLKKISEAEDYYLNFLRDLADTIESGMNFYKALIFISKNKYGPLTKYIRDAAKDLIIGKPFAKVIEDLKRKLSLSELISRTLDVIVSVFYIGGNIVQVLNYLYHSLSTIKAIEKEKSTVLTQQAVVMTMIFFIFLIIIYLIYNSIIPIFFISSLASKYSSELKLATAGLFIKSSLSFKDIKSIFTLLVFLVSFSVGSIVGFILNRKISSALRYSIIFLTFSIFFYLIVIKPPYFDVSTSNRYLKGIGGKTFDFVGIASVDGEPLRNTILKVYFNKKIFFVKTDNNGNIEIKLNLPKEGGEYTLKICYYDIYNKPYCKKFSIEVI